MAAAARMAAARDGRRSSLVQRATVMADKGGVVVYAPVPTTVTEEGTGEPLLEPPRNDCQGFANIICGHPILSTMLLSVPLGFVTKRLQWPNQIVFGFNFLGIIPLAWLIGKSTEDLSAATGETVGGLLNATFGNVVEMLLCIAGIRNNEIIVVQCTLIGSILSNLLLVLGCAFFCGGLYHKVQIFSQEGACMQCSLMSLGVFAIGLPTLSSTILTQDAEWDHMVSVSRISAVILLAVYFAYLFFQLKSHAFLFESEGGGAEAEEEDPPDLSPYTAAVLLGLCTVITSFATDNVMDGIKDVVKSCQLSKEFIGVIMLPIIGNAAEHYTAISVAMRNKMNLSIGVAVGSSCQMALLVTPMTVIFGWVYGTDMTLDFHCFQFLALFLSVFLTGGIVNNGTSNWLEGPMLLIAYILLAVVYFFEGAGEDASLATLY